jgi:hypothetical protein
MGRSNTTFPLRFENERTRAALHELAEQLGTSMNRLAQDALAAHLGLVASVVEDRLERSLAALRSYRGGWSDEEIAAFARGEARHEDPAEGRAVRPPDEDPFGVQRAFADPMGR